MKPYGRMLVVLLCMIATAIVLQGMFDASDHTKSERIVRSYRGAVPHATAEPGAPSGTASSATLSTVNALAPLPPTLGERVEAAAPGGEWSSEILHGCRGFVRVRYAAPTGEYLFDYDVPEHRIHPANPAAESILAAMPSAPPPPK